MRFLLPILVLLLAGAASAEPTYSKEISRILQEKCQNCHRPDQIAPFSLLTYADAKVWHRDIARVVEDGYMPPWKPTAGGPFKGDFSLTDEEKSLILAWSRSGAPEGDPADLPEPKEWASTWQNGDPDLVLEMAEPFAMQRDKDQYRCFVLPSGQTEDRWLRSLEVVPGNRGIVHHVLLYIDSTGVSEKLDADDEGPGYDCFGGPQFQLKLGGQIGAWVPGQRSIPLEDGTGIFLPKNARVVMQVHYFPAASTDPDQTKIGMYFTPETPENRLVSIPIANARFVVEPGEKKDVTSEFTMPIFLSAEVAQMGPHMHLVGTAIKMEYKKANSDSWKPLVGIDKWDFNWQGSYSLMEPLKLESRDKVRLTCTFTNTEDNPKNPHNPLVPIRWGEGTGDEMCLGYLGVKIPVNNALFNFLLGL